MKKIFLILVVIGSVSFGQTFNKKFNVKERVTGNAEKVGEFNFVEYSVKDAEGKELYQIVDKVDYDIPHSKLEVFNNGASVLINSFYGGLTFISNDGTKTKRIKLRDDIDVEYERNIFTATDDDLLLAAVSEQTENFTLFKVYDFTATPVAEFKVNYKNISGVAFSKKLNRIFVSRIIWDNSGTFNKEIVVYDLNGKRLKSFNAKFEKGFFTENKFIGYDNKSVISVDCKSLTKLFEKTSPQNEMIISVVPDDSDVVVVTAQPPKLKDGKWYYQNPTIIKMNPKGKVLKKETMETVPFAEFNFVQDGKTSKFIAGNKEMIID